MRRATAALAGCATAPQPSAGPTTIDVARFRAINVESDVIAPSAAALGDADRAALEHKLHRLRDWGVGISGHLART